MKFEVRGHGGVYSTHNTEESACEEAEVIAKCFNVDVAVVQSTEEKRPIFGRSFTQTPLKSK